MLFGSHLSAGVIGNQPTASSQSCSRRTLGSGPSTHIMPENTNNEVARKQKQHQTRRRKIGQADQLPGPNRSVASVGLDSECIRQLLDVVAYYHVYDANELRALCFSIWVTCQPCQDQGRPTSFDTRSGDAEQPWADGCIPSSPEQFA